MKDLDFNIDIHAHPTLRAYNTPVSKGKRNLWEKTFNQEFDTPVGRWARIKTREIAKYSQSNLDAYAQSNTRVVFDSLYPVEKGFLNFNRLPTTVFGKAKSDQVLRAVTGIDTHQLRALRNNHDYFEELLAQYAFAVKGQGPSPDGDKAYRIVGNYSELKSVLEADDHTIAIVFTIEGAHAFNCGLPKYNGYRRTEKPHIIQNINIAKSWKYPPFMVNLAHHFYNELCGHSRSFKPLIYNVFNQKEGINGGFNELGWAALHELLAKDNGRRILVDIKHMSVLSRKDYYRFINIHNRLNPNDNIPIVCSHTGVNDFEDMEASGIKKDHRGKMKNGQFHNWSINLSMEEIRIIYESDGLIGIMLDKSLLTSLARINEIREMADKQASRKAFVEMILDNIFRVVAACGGAGGWDILALGTDYDGLITHVDIYPDAASIRELANDLVSYMKEHSYQKDLWYGREPEQLIGKILNGNTMAFMEKYF